jgi:hypothetical protein
MYASTHFMSAHDLKKIATKTAEEVLPDEDAQSLPFAHKDPKYGMVVMILYYRESGPPSKRVVNPPHHAMYLDPATGKVLRFWAATPDELGIETPVKPAAGPSARQGMPWQELFEKRQRFLDISPAVWEAFASGASQVPGETRAMLHDYRNLLFEITKPEVTPFYLEAAPDFFGWLDGIVRSH